MYFYAVVGVQIANSFKFGVSHQQPEHVLSSIVGEVNYDRKLLTAEHQQRRKTSLSPSSFCVILKPGRV
jgi:hypothetical protein